MAGERAVDSREGQMASLRRDTHARAANAAHQRYRVGRFRPVRCGEVSVRVTGGWATSALLPVWTS
uniref:Uncharacterized protein n=1 Tax=Oryza sativa subsp. japonica TaxID=39947 RepID=Q94HM0_ORYSJ|nr:Hypothetical protein [Oryza sativa Japonica Group]